MFPNVNRWHFPKANTSNCGYLNNYASKQVFGIFLYSHTPISLDSNIDAEDPANLEQNFKLYQEFQGTTNKIRICLFTIPSGPFVLKEEGVTIHNLNYYFDSCIYIDSTITVENFKKDYLSNKGADGYFLTRWRGPEGVEQLETYSEDGPLNAKDGDVLKYMPKSGVDMTKTKIGEICVEFKYIFRAKISTFSGEHSVCKASIVTVGDLKESISQRIQGVDFSQHVLRQMRKNIHRRVMNILKPKYEILLEYKRNTDQVTINGEDIHGISFLAFFPEDLFHADNQKEVESLLEGLDSSDGLVETLEDPSIKFMVELQLEKKREIALREATTVGQLKEDYRTVHTPAEILNRKLVLFGNDGKEKHTYHEDSEKIITEHMDEGDVLKFVAPKETKAGIRKIKDEFVGIVKKAGKIVGKLVEKIFQLPMPFGGIPGFLSFLLSFLLAAQNVIGEFLPVAMIVLYFIIFVKIRWDSGLCRHGRVSTQNRRITKLEKAFLIQSFIICAMYEVRYAAFCQTHNARHCDWSMAVFYAILPTIH
ncbi:hypothetical protein DdX_10129 [Ditylenchus destructor]|uniref:Uncharacterized protein n=1 Tax=Ditylenchus destructor TaxID=166010 RepID=A0AAD4N2Q7_9BILA|nr:hypothetical protein DdX_10129 [Ditylenchus destructor]